VLAYNDELKTKLVNLVKEATVKLRPALIGSGKGECRLNVNRRERCPQGGIMLGQNFAGPCDHEVGVIRIVDEMDNSIAILINWPCHGTIMGSKNYQITGDWSGAVSTYVEREYENNLIALVTVGASGDINPLYRSGSVNPLYRERSDFDEVDLTGALLGKEVMRVEKNIMTLSCTSLSASQRLITLPGKERGSPKVGRCFLPQSDYTSGPDVDVRLSALKIGNIVLVGVSGEVMNEIGIKLKALSPFNYTYMITHCNGSSGYLVTDDAYEQGGYEVSRTRVMSGAESAIIENLVDMINGL
jgi:hypothetical protein